MAVRGRRVVRIKLFQGHHAGPQGGDHVGHALMDLQQAAGERAPRLAADHARLAQPRRPAADFQHAVAGDVQAGVDAEDAVGGWELAFKFQISNFRSQISNRTRMNHFGFLDPDHEAVTGLRVLAEV